MLGLVAKVRELQHGSSLYGHLEREVSILVGQGKCLCALHPYCHSSEGLLLRGEHVADDALLLFILLLNLLLRLRLLRLMIAALELRLRLLCVVIVAIQRHSRRRQ